MPSVVLCRRVEAAVSLMSAISESLVPSHKKVRDDLSLALDGDWSPPLEACGCQKFGRRR